MNLLKYEMIKTYSINKNQENTIKSLELTENLIYEKRKIKSNIHKL